MRGPDVFAPFLGESEANLRRVFADAVASARQQPTILFIDEASLWCG